MMKRTLLLFMPFWLVFVGSMINKADSLFPDKHSAKADLTGVETTMQTNHSASRMRIRVGSHTFMAALLNNATVTAFKAKLPITLSMNELNRNEKYAELPTTLPTDVTNPRTIQTGDLMLYGASTLVLFYNSFQTSYSYTRLGHVGNSEELAIALGSGNVTVTFELE